MSKRLVNPIRVFTTTAAITFINFGVVHSETMIDVLSKYCVDTKSSVFALTALTSGGGWKEIPLEQVPVTSTGNVKGKWIWGRFVRRGNVTISVMIGKVNANGNDRYHDCQVSMNPFDEGVFSEAKSWSNGLVTEIGRTDPDAASLYFFQSTQNGREPLRVADVAAAISQGRANILTAKIYHAQNISVLSLISTE